jgi:hypothetical protein
MLFKGEEALLLDKLAKIAAAVPIRHFEVQGAGLEEIFVELVKTERNKGEPELTP